MRIIPCFVRILGQGVAVLVFASDEQWIRYESGKKEDTCEQLELNAAYLVFIKYDTGLIEMVEGKRPNATCIWHHNHTGCM